MEVKKYLGQNFLTRDHYAKVMRDAAGVSNVDTIVEIGPGKGVLTEILLESAHKVIAVEKDRELIPLLSQKFEKEIKNKKLELLEKDIREFKPKKNYKLVANIPYYITGEIIRNFLEAKNQPVSITLMIQKEVAERILARDKKESLLSLSVKAYGTPKIIARVGAGNFSPKPKVDSAILHIESISKEFFKGTSEKKFFQMLHAGFAHKRKVLISNLSSLYPRERLNKIFQEENLDPRARAENLTLKEWRTIASRFS